MSEIHWEKVSNRFEGRIGWVFSDFISLWSLQTKARALKTGKKGVWDSFFGAFAT